MKKLFLIIIVIFSKVGLCQNTPIGCYERTDSKIRINDDSTFTFFYSVDTYRGWARGIGN